MTKLCKDCKWSRVSWLDWLFLGGNKFAKCAAPSISRRTPPSSIRFDLVNGSGKEEDKGEMFFCASNREFECGEEARFWEPKR